MAKKKCTPEEEARRAAIRELLSKSNISSMDDIQELFRETIAAFMEASLESKLDEALGYEPYDYAAKKASNSRNGHSVKTLRTSFGNAEIAVPRDRQGDFDPQILKKRQTSIS